MLFQCYSQLLSFLFSPQGQSLVYEVSSSFSGDRSGTHLLSAITQHLLFFSHLWILAGFQANPEQITCDLKKLIQKENKPRNKTDSDCLPQWWLKARVRCTCACQESRKWRQCRPIFFLRALAHQAVFSRVQSSHTQKKTWMVSLLMYIVWISHALEDINLFLVGFVFVFFVFFFVGSLV